MARFKIELDNWITREPEYEEEGEHDEDDPKCPCYQCSEDRWELARDEAADRKREIGY